METIKACPLCGGPGRVPGVRPVHRLEDLPGRGRAEVEPETRGRGKPLPYRENGGGAMRIFWAWLIGMTTGVGLMIWTKGVSASQVHLLELYGTGVIVGMAAAAIAAAPWTEGEAREGQAPPLQGKRGRPPHE